MRSLVALLLLLCLALIGCSDDAEPADGGTDAITVEAGTDAGADAAPADAAQAGDLGAGEQAVGLDAVSELGTDQGEDQ